MKKIISILFGIIIAVNLAAQDPFQDEFDSFFKQATQEFDDFRDRINNEYAEYLLSNWKEFNAMAPMEKPGDKPLPPVSYEGDRDIVKESRPVPFDSVVTVKEKGKKAKPAGPVKKQKGTGTRDIHFSCFGMPLSINVPAAKEFKLASTDTRDLSKAWKKLSTKDFDVILADCLAIRDRENLCDWAYLNMLHSFAVQMLGEGDSATFLTAYIFAQSGYRMRLAVDSDKLRFLYGTDFIIYGKPYYPIGESNYFVFNGESQMLKIADIPYPDETDLSLIMDSEQNFGNTLTKERGLKSERYSVSVKCAVKEGQIEFFGTYPSGQIGEDYMTRWAIYANSPFSNEVKDEIYPSLKNKIEGKGKLEAADILLDFVQTAFEYEYDDNIWGADRVFFAEETLFYPYCDCEDRSILFSRLVRDLLDLKVALIYYPGHLATAVRFPDGPAGDYLSLEDGEYTVCDPTFIGAPVGNTMPGMNNSEATVILLP